MCEIAQSNTAPRLTLMVMSERNGDKARFQKDRKRKMLRRQRIHALMAGLQKRADDEASSRAGSLNMRNEGGQARIGD
jgi:hypothetical protein